MLDIILSILWGNLFFFIFLLYRNKFVATKSREFIRLIHLRIFMTTLFNEKPLYKQEELYEHAFLSYNEMLAQFWKWNTKKLIKNQAGKLDYARNKKS